MDNKNICSSCGTENETEYKYCKNCGSELNAEAKSFEPKINTEYKAAAPEQSFKEMPNGIIIDNISGVSSDEIALFIGKKAYNILPKFSKMELSNSKVSWCWPVAVLGYLFGPFGAAFWFFYRKMYKPAVILSVVGAVLTIIITLMTGGINFDFEAVMDALISGDMDAYASAIESVSPEETVFSAVAAIIENAASIASCILGGLFGFYIYKNHCIEKITTYRAIQADKRYYKMGLASIGGVSGGMATLGVVIMIMAENFATVIATLINI